MRGLGQPSFFVGKTRISPVYLSFCFCFGDILIVQYFCI